MAENKISFEFTEDEAITVASALRDFSRETEKFLERMRKSSPPKPEWFLVELKKEMKEADAMADHIYMELKSLARKVVVVTEG